METPYKTLVELFQTNKIPFYVRMKNKQSRFKVIRGSGDFLKSYQNFVLKDQGGATYLIHDLARDRIWEKIDDCF